MTNYESAVGHGGDTLGVVATNSEVIGVAGGDLTQKNDRKLTKKMRNLFYYLKKFHKNLFIKRFPQKKQASIEN